MDCGWVADRPDPFGLTTRLRQPKSESQTAQAATISRGNWMECVQRCATLWLSALSAMLDAEPDGRPRRALESRRPNATGLLQRNVDYQLFRSVKPSLSCRPRPWIHNGDAASLEVIAVPRREPGAVMSSDCGDLRIKLRNWPPRGTARTDDVDLGRYRGAVERQDAATEVFVESRTQGRFQSGAPLAWRKQPGAQTSRPG